MQSVTQFDDVKYHEMIVMSRKYKGTAGSSVAFARRIVRHFALRIDRVIEGWWRERGGGGDGRALAYRLTAYCSLKG